MRRQLFPGLLTPFTASIRLYQNPFHINSNSLGSERMEELFPPSFQNKAKNILPDERRYPPGLFRD